MNMSEIPHRWHIPRSAIQHSIGEMAIDGRRGCEGIAMWLGHFQDDTAIVTHIALLRGPGIQKMPYQIVISADLVNDLTDVAIDLNVVLVGQIHSHGPLHGTHLSETDKRYGICSPGYLSVVAPNYAMDLTTEIDQLGFHIFEDGGWRRLSSSAARNRVVIPEELEVAVVTAGRAEDRG
jgi:hypothetical protein